MRKELAQSMHAFSAPVPGGRPGEMTLSGRQVEALTKAITTLADEATSGNRLVKAVIFLSLLGFLGSVGSVIHVSSRFDDASASARARMELFEAQRQELLTASREALEGSRKAVKAAQEAAHQSAVAAADSADVTVRLAPQRERPALQVRAAKKKAKARALAKF